MPALQQIILSDGATPAVNHTFVPRDVTNGTGLVVNGDGVMAGEGRLSIGGRPTASRRFKSTFTLTIPVDLLEPAADGSMISHVGSFRGEFTFSDRSTPVERRDLVAMVRSALDPTKPLVYNTIVNNERVYGS